MSGVGSEKWDYHTKTDYAFILRSGSYLHLRYNLGSGEVNIEYNTTRVSDGLWHRIRAFR